MEQRDHSWLLAHANMAEGLYGSKIPMMVLFFDLHALMAPARPGWLDVQAATDVTPGLPISFRLIRRVGLAYVNPPPNTNPLAADVKLPNENTVPRHDSASLDVEKQPEPAHYPGAVASPRHDQRSWLRLAPYFSIF